MLKRTRAASGGAGRVAAAAVAAGMLCLTACATTIGLSTSSGPPVANSRAADVRARMALLYGEHTYVLAKLTLAAAAGRKDEYASYAGLLAANGNDLTAAFSRAVGEAQGQRLGQALLFGDGFFVDDIVATTTQQKDMADAAISNLNTKFVSRLAPLLSSVLNISNSTATRLLDDEVSSTTQFIGNAAAGYAGSYSEVRAAYMKSTAMGAALGEAIVWKFPDKYPGDATNGASKQRTRLDALLQEHAYLTSMATEAAANTGTAADYPAAGSYLDLSTNDLADEFGNVFGAHAGDQARQIWLDQNRSFVAYASASDDAARNDALVGLNERSTPNLAALLASVHVTADVASVTHEEIGVIDDQRAKSFAVIAAEDRQSAALLVSIGDLMMGSGSV